MRFAEKNHKLVYAFLQEQRYDPGEYYDLAVMGYLHTVERYCSHAYLRRFSFSTVAYRAMQQSIVSWKRGESRRLSLIHISLSAEDRACLRSVKPGYGLWIWKKS